MENYYELLGLSENALVGEMDAELKSIQRKWQSRTNAPDLVKRQEAEVMLKHAIKAREILLDEKKKADYNKQLKNSKTVEGTTVAPNLYDSSELLKEAKQMIALNQIADALLLLKRLVIEDPKNVEAQSNYGYCLFRMQRHKEAIPAYETALAMKPDDMNVFYDLIYIYVDMKEYSIAEQYLNKAFKTVGEIEPFLRLKTYILNAQQKYDQTIEIIEAQNAAGKKLSNDMLFDLCEAYEGKSMAFYQKGKDGYYYLTEDTHVDEVLKYWEKIIVYKDIYEDSLYPQKQYDKVAKLKNKQFFKGAWKAYIIPILVGLSGFMMMSEGDSNGSLFLMLSVGYVVLLSYLAMVPGFKYNKAVVNGTDLGIQKMMKLNGAVIGVFTFMFVLIAKAAFSSNKSR